MKRQRDRRRERGRKEEKKERSARGEDISQRNDVAGTDGRCATKIKTEFYRCVL